LPHLLQKNVVIVVDDDLTILELLRYQITDAIGADCDVELATSGGEVDDLLHALSNQNRNVKVLVTDYFLDDIAYSGQTGKDTGKDMDKPTIVSKIGKSDASKMMHHHLDAAREHLYKLGGNTQSLAVLIDYGFSRFRS
jgi:CheY-like chemotaxis protein